MLVSVYGAVCDWVVSGPFLQMDLMLLTVTLVSIMAFGNFAFERKFPEKNLQVNLAPKC